MNDAFGLDGGSSLNTYFDLTDTKADTGYSTLEPGEYPVMSDYAEIKPTKAGTGKYLSIKFRVFEGAAEGRNLFHNFNLANPNAKAVEIGLAQLKGWMVAAKAPTKLEGLNDVITNICGYKATAIVTVEESEQYGNKNVILKFKPYTSLGDINL